MKFAHISDCHIGCWRDPILREAMTRAFCQAIDSARAESAEFILISGDLFDTAQPPIDHLKTAVLKLKECKDAKIPVYAVYGSHDYSPSGKTILDVLDAAGLAKNVAQASEHDGKLRLCFTTDAKTGAKICGMVGRKGGLEREYYPHLDLKQLESEPGQKIFLFHSAVHEHRPKGYEDTESVPLSLLPKGFAYYAGGHIHCAQSTQEEGYGLFGNPGPTFPTSMPELERSRRGGFIMYEDGKARHIPLEPHPVTTILIDAKGMTPTSVEEKALIEARSERIPGSIVALRAEGTLASGKASDIPWNRISQAMTSNGAICVIRNTHKVTSPETAPIQSGGSTVEEIEDRVIAENTGQSKAFEKKPEGSLVRELMAALSSEKGESETAHDYESRLTQACEELISKTARPCSDA